MNGVEQQIDSRRKEVDDWVAKCEDVEKHCLGYARALGGNVKATGNSLEELKKERVLPRRYDLISEHQEKLRQVCFLHQDVNPREKYITWCSQLYQTKLEQLNTLTNRLNALVRTLGSDFFSREFMEQPPTQDQEADNDSSYRDVTPEKFLKLEKELVRGKAEVVRSIFLNFLFCCSLTTSQSKRLTELLGTFVQIDWLYTELGITPPSPDGPGTSSLAVPASLSSPSYANISLQEDPFAISTPTPGTRKSQLLFNPIPSLSSTPIVASSTSPCSETDYQRIFISFVGRLEEMVDADAQPASALLPDVDPSPALLSWAAATQSHLEGIKRAREASIQAMYDQLEPLWRRLGVSDEDMDAFVEQHRGSTEQIVREYQEELARMLELKRESMHAFVASAREEITKLWDELMIGEEERADFAPFFDGTQFFFCLEFFIVVLFRFFSHLDEATEELLAIHEDEVRRLKEDRRSKAHLLAAIRKYFDICREERELAAAASDQSRLLGRGPRDPGRLLREEKMRKRVSKEKPRVCSFLSIHISN
jgi:Ase1/PRC1/MAP65 family protein